MNTRVEVILGCMYSGKSTELIRRINRYESIGKNILLINHTKDVRTDNNVSTHSNQKKNAKKTEFLSDLIHSLEFTKADVIGIDEAQFFTDLYDFIVQIEKFNKIVIVAGLDGDYQRKPIGQILNIIPLSDSVIKLTALDMETKDGSLAIFTKRLVNSNQQILVGSTDEYMAVSRGNYLKNNEAINNDNLVTDRLSQVLDSIESFDQQVFY